jgi:hypothetical protein
VILLSPIRRLLGVAGWTRPSFFVTPPALRAARDTIAVLPDVAKAVLVLPTLSQQLGYVCRNTDRLAQVVEQLERVESDTSVLPEMRDEFAVVRSTITDTRRDTAAIAAEMPKLVVLEQSLPAMVPMLEDLDRSVHQLAHIAEPLHGAARRLGRMSDRLPERNGR